MQTKYMGGTNLQTKLKRSEEIYLFLKEHNGSHTIQQLHKENPLWGSWDAILGCIRHLERLDRVGTIGSGVHGTEVFWVRQ